MDNISGSLANPLPDRNEVMVFILTSDEENEANFKEALALLKKKFGLDVMKSTEGIDCNEGTAQHDFTSVIDCLLNSIEHKIISKSDWFGFSVDGQQKGVLAKASTDGPTFLDVVIFKGFTINSDGKLRYCLLVGHWTERRHHPFQWHNFHITCNHHDIIMQSDVSLLLKFETASYRVVKPPLSDLLPQQEGDLTVIEENTGIIQPSSYFIIPTGEEVQVERNQTSYKGILASKKEIAHDESKVQEVHVSKKRKKNSTSTQRKSDLIQLPPSSLHLPAQEKPVQSLLLTDYDLKNRSRGYSLFLPETKEECDEYWRVAYGVNLCSEYIETRKRCIHDNQTDGEGGNGRGREEMREGGKRDGRRGEKEGDGGRGGRQEDGGGVGGGGGYNVTEVTMQLGDKRVLPTQLLARSVTPID